MLAWATLALCSWRRRAVGSLLCRPWLDSSHVFLSLRKLCCLGDVATIAILSENPPPGQGGCFTPSFGRSVCHSRVRRAESRRLKTGNALLEPESAAASCDTCRNQWARGEGCEVTQHTDFHRLFLFTEHCTWCHGDKTDNAAIAFESLSYRRHLYIKLQGLTK